MLRVSALLVCLVASSFAAPELNATKKSGDGRIYSGNKVNLSKYPYVVVIAMGGTENQMAMGVIISKYFVLSATNALSYPWDNADIYMNAEEYQSLTGLPFRSSKKRFVLESNVEKTLQLYKVCPSFNVGTTLGLASAPAATDSEVVIVSFDDDTGNTRYLVDQTVLIANDADCNGMNDFVAAKHVCLKDKPSEHVLYYETAGALAIAGGKLVGMFANLHETATNEHKNFVFDIVLNKAWIEGIVGQTL